LVVLTGSLDARVELAIHSQEPSVLTRYAFELAQLFNVFYHKHPILKEPDRMKRTFLLFVAALVHKQLVTTLGLLGIDAPEKM
jgi:arginyl-tRNA synthetase